MLDRTIPFYNVILKWNGSKVMAPVLPDGYHFRAFQDGDEKEWAKLEYEIGDFCSPEEAEEYFLSTYCNQSRLDIHERCLFVVDAGNHFAGACIAWNDLRGNDFVASLHWLIVSPKYQGNGIGKALCQKTMQLFVSKHELPVYTHTQPWSYKAILLYIAQGFRLQRTDTFSYYENQFEKAMKTLKGILTREQYYYLADKTDC